MKRVGEITKSSGKKYSIRPRYSVVLHDVREKLDLSLATYVVTDSVHKLSQTNPEHPYCTISKEQLAEFLKLSRATVFRSLDEGIKKGLIERTKQGHLRTTPKWVMLVEIYSIKTA